MSLRFHWSLPTSGDGRDIVGGGHGVATAGYVTPFASAESRQDAGADRTRQPAAAS
jgi:hypothetical protein